MSDIFQTDEYIVKDNPYLDQGSGESGELDTLSDSTTAITDDDKIATRQNSDGVWYKKTFAKVWDYIKGKIGIDAEGDNTKFLNELGIFDVPPLANGARRLVQYDLSPAAYTTNDTHILKLGYVTFTNAWGGHITLLCTSAFWGNQHGSSDIIDVQFDYNSGNLFTALRVKLGGSTERVFYTLLSDNKLYIYVNVQGGNGYGRWNVSVIQDNYNKFVSDYATNQTISGQATIPFGGKIDRAVSDIDGNELVQKYVSVFNTNDIGNSNTVTVNDLAAAGNTVGMIYGGTDNPQGSGKWTHILSLCWKKGVVTSWISQLAFGVTNGTGMWYRTTSNSIIGKTWKQLLDTDHWNVLTKVTDITLTAANSTNISQIAARKEANGMVHINGVMRLGASVAVNGNMNVFSGIPAPALQQETFCVGLCYEAHVTCLFYYTGGYIQLYKPSAALASGSYVTINMCYKASS